MSRVTCQSDNAVTVPNGLAERGKLVQSISGSGSEYFCLVGELEERGSDIYNIMTIAFCVENSL